MDKSTEVLIIGAGPTGLMMAGQLALHGVPFRIIDKNADHTTQSRALVVQARSLEIFDQMGVADEAIRLGRKAEAVNAILKSRRMLRIPLGEMGKGLTKFPYLLILEQSRTEEILNDFLARRGHAVERLTELTDFGQEPDSIAATVQHANGKEETVRACWLVGAEGAHSLVRTRLDIPFTGKTYEQSLFVLDCKANLDFPPGEIYFAFSERSIAGFFPLPNGRTRVIGTVPEGLEGEESLTFEQVSENFAQRVHMDLSLYDPEWVSVYRSHHRVVSSFRKGRCFLAGDAAHIHSPVGGQGMNTGLQDAYNLAWKLALVVTGKAKQSLLDSYNDERIRIAENLVRTTDQVFNFVTSQKPFTRGMRTRVLPPILRAMLPLVQKGRFIRRFAFKTLSEIGIHYRSSPLSRQDPGSRFPEDAPKAGDRVPHLGFPGHAPFGLEMVRGTAFHLLLFLGEDVEECIEGLRRMLEKEHPGLIEFHSVPLAGETREVYQRFGIRKQGFYLIRPDGHIAYRNSSFTMEDFNKYLKSFLT